jgi:NADH-quinone oxidoreductase subunit D
VKHFLDELEPVIDEIDKLLSRNRIFIERTQDIGVISKEDAIAYGLTGPNLRGSGVEHDLRKAQPYLDYDKYEFDVPVGHEGRLL